MATIIPFPAPAPGEPGEALFLALMQARDSGAVVFGVVVEFVRREAEGDRAFHKGMVRGPVALGGVDDKSASPRAGA